MAAKKKPSTAEKSVAAVAGERWAAVPGFNGLYEVSDFGRVRSLLRSTPTGLLGGKILKANKARNEYLRVTLSASGIAQRESVHRLVLSAFVRAPADGEEARHLDGDRENNALTNLAWGTRSDNAKDRIRHGTQFDNRGQKHGNARLSDQQAAEIKRLRDAGNSLVDIAKSYGVSAPTVSRIANSKGWQHIGESEVAEETITAFKGFDKDFKCRGFAFEVGKTYGHDGDVEACASGFHACEHPLHVFRYYKPGLSRFARVTLGGKTDRHSDDTKIAAARITIEAELSISDFAAAAVKWVFGRAKWKEGAVARGANEGATASGDYGAASASGDSGAATASGDSGAATASGYSGAATASGYSGAATASGYSGKARGKDGCALFLVERDTSGRILNVWAGIAGRDGIKADTFYTLKNGRPVEV